ncbi:MAG: VCBS repeat-containing protein [Candidatus Altiarchaeota archaeon]|nr:VCBS repeat-containing protein [Candidatus Altiarchaeota archaeon]
MRSLVVSIVLVIVLFGVVDAQQAEVLKQVWNDSLAPSMDDRIDIVGIWVEDLNLDSHGETAIVTAGVASTSNANKINRLHLYRQNGSLYGAYGIDDHVRAATIFDLNNDGIPEFIITSGEKLNKIQRGSVKIISSKGNLLREFSSTALTNTLEVVDIEGDKYYEILSGSEQKVYLQGNHGEKIWEYPGKGGGTFFKEVGDVAAYDIDRDGKLDVIAGSDGVYVINSNSVLAGNIDLEPELTTLKKGTKFIYETGSTKGSEAGIMVMTESNQLFKIELMQINSNSKIGFYLIDRYVNISWTIDPKCDILDSEKTNIDNDGQPEFLIACRENKVLAIDDKGSIKWEYFLDGAAEDISLEDMDLDTRDDILVATSSGSIYLLSLDGEYMWRYSSGKPLQAVAGGSGGPSGSKQVSVVTTDGVAIGYEINEEYNTQRQAEKLFNLGQHAFLMSDFPKAKKYMEDAKVLYVKLGDERNVAECESFIRRVDDLMAERAIEEADIFLVKAREYYYQQDYENAKLYTKRAKEMYEKYRDREGVVKCELLELEIEKAIEIYRTHATVAVNATSIQFEDESSSITSTMVIVVGIVVLIGAYIIYSRKKKKPKDNRTIESLTQGWGSDFIDEKKNEEEVKNEQK